MALRRPRTHLGADAGLVAVGPINALLMPPDPAQRLFLALTGAGPFAADDGGADWRQVGLAEAGGLTCVAAPLGLAPGVPLFAGR